MEECEVKEGIREGVPCLSPWLTVLAHILLPLQALGSGLASVQSLVHRSMLSHSSLRCGILVGAGAWSPQAGKLSRMGSQHTGLLRGRTVWLSATLLHPSLHEAEAEGTAPPCLPPEVMPTHELAVLRTDYSGH